VGAPNPPELTLTDDGNQLQGTATFFQGGTKYIRLFTSDCATTFSGPPVEFKYDNDNGVETETIGSVYSYDSAASAAAKGFTLPLDDLHQHLSGTNDGSVTICIQLESVNTIQNFVRTINLDLTDGYTVTITAQQPGADIADVTVETDVIAWVCDNTSDDPLIDDALDSVEVPGKIYVCIQATEGFEIQSGGLEVDSSITTADPDHSITNYMALETGIKNNWDEDDTVQTWAGKPNLARVSFMGQSDWAPTATADEQLTATLTIVVTAQFDPVRRLATVSAIASDDIERRHLRQIHDDVRQREVTDGEDQEEASQFHWGRLRQDGTKVSTRDKPKLKTGIFSPDFTHPAMEIATATTTVLVRGPAPVDTSISAPIAGVIGSAILLCMAGCCFFLAFCCKRRRDSDEVEDDKSFPDSTKRTSFNTQIDDSSDGEDSKLDGLHGFDPLPMASLYGGRAA